MNGYLFMAEGFEEIEAITVIDLLRRAAIAVTTVSITKSQLVVGAHGITVQADVLYESTNFDNADVLILPGGMPGTRYLDKYEPLCHLLRTHSQEGRLIAAICAAPSILGRLGLLKDHRATCYPGFEEALVGASLIDQGVVVDTPFITARSLGSAIGFALAIIEYLKGSNQAIEVAEAIVL